MSKEQETKYITINDNDVAVLQINYKNEHHVNLITAVMNLIVQDSAYDLNTEYMKKFINSLATMINTSLDIQLYLLEEL